MTVPIIPQASYPEVTLTAEVSVYHFTSRPDEHWLQVSGTVFGPFPTEDEAILAIGSCMTMVN